MSKTTRPGLQAFGVELTRHREEAGLTRTELARRVNVTRSYVGQVESGTTRCRRDFAERLGKELGIGAALTDLWEDVIQSTGYPKWFDFPKAEASAILLRAYQGFVIDGLLQTEDYARALLPTEEAVAGRMARQRILARETPPLLVVILDESVLLREVGGRKVMRDQLDHLIAVMSDRVIVQVARLAWYRGVAGSFVIATQPDRSEVVYLENAVRGETNADPDGITRVTETFATLQAHALSPRESCGLIRRIAEERYGVAEVQPQR